jgi:cell division GTPase FtsZ
MSNSGDKRWEEKDDGINTLLRDQNEELLKKYKHQCQISKDLAKENEALFNSRRKYTVAIDEIKQILQNLA